MGNFKGTNMRTRLGSLATALALAVCTRGSYAHAHDHSSTELASLVVASSSSSPTSPPAPPSTAGDWAPGAVLHGYELVERTALLGVCNHVARKGKGEGTRSRLAARGHSERAERVKAVVAVDDDASHRQVAVVVEAAVSSDGGAFPVVHTEGPEGGEEGEDAEEATRGVIPEGPSLEYQCLLEDIDLIYVNSNYRLRKKFAAGSHGEVWRATRQHQPNSGEAFILKRLFVEHGEMMVEMGLREAYFGKLLANEPHVTRFVEYFFRGVPTQQDPTSETAFDSDRTTATSHQPFSTAYPAAYSAAVSAVSPRPLRASASLLPDDGSPPQSETISDPHLPNRELWLVFYDEGISLRNYLYASRESAHTAVLFEASPFWHKLRVDAHGEDVLREIMRQLLEGVAALHDRGITHRDIKPSNILVHLQRQEDDGRDNAHRPPPFTAPIVKLADFGSAVDDHTFRHLYGERGPTQAEETREYQAPEVLFSEFGAPYDYANPLAYDMWSVGVVFLEMVLGSPQVFMISPRARAKLDAKLRITDEATRLKTYLLHALTHEFCIYQPSPHELQKLWEQHALASDSCHFGRFNTTIIERDPMRTGLRNRWGLDLMWKLLQWNPSQRITARAALEHAFFKGPYVCSESGRQFATLAELKTHESYLAIQRAREQEMAFVVREKYDLPTEFTCPHCHRNFSTIASCEQHLVARKHHIAARTHFCDHDHESMRDAIQHDTIKYANATGETHAGMALLQGKKKYMEDFVVAHRDERLNLSIYAVIDGHLGTGAADYVRTHLAATFVEHLETLERTKYFADESHVLERVLMRQVFLELHKGFIDGLAHEVTPDFSGCTLTLVVHFEAQGRVLSANVGDSRAIFVAGDEIYPLSKDHWPNDEDERRRIESSGGFVSYEGLWRVVGQLAVSRSIGDWHLRKYVTAEPSVFTLDLRDLMPRQGGVLVIASDGVWDTMENTDIGHFLADRQPQSLQQVALDLVQEAFLRGSLDNLAAVVVNLTLYG